MKQRIHLITLICAILPLVMCSSPKAGKTDFSAALREADSVYNHMAFDKAYGMYLKMLDLPEVRSDDGKRLETLYSLCLVSEISGWNNDRLDWLDRLIDLARSTGDDYYLSQGLMLLGKHVFHSGDRGQGVAYIREAVDLLQHTDRPSTDHLTHSSLNVLSSLLCDMKDFDAAVEVDERNVRLTYEGTRWGTYPQVQLRDRRTALAKLAAHQVQAGKAQRADSTYLRWKEVALEEGSNPKDYFIVDYLRERGRYGEAAGIYEGLIKRIRTQSDTLGNMMLYAKWGLAEVMQKMGEYRRASETYAQVLEIKDTLQARQARANVQQLAVLYETQKKDHQLHVRAMWLTALCCGSLLAALTLAALFFYTRKVREKNRFMAQMLDELSSRNALPKEASNEAPTTVSGESPAEAPRQTASPPQSSAEKPEDKSQDKSQDKSAALFLALDKRLDSERAYLNPDLNRDDLCRLIDVDKNVLGGIIKQYSGAPNSQVYINRKRIQYAVVLLRQHPEWTIMAVSESCGMRNTVTFNRIFRQTYGITPTEYLKGRPAAEEKNL